MEYSINNEIKRYIFKYRKILFILLYIFIIFVLISVFKEGYSGRIEKNEFDEIQKYLLEIRENDKDIYNKLEVELVYENVKGIDVSSWQGEIDWEKVKATGIDFVMIRCGFRNLTNEEILVDKTFHYNIKEANRLGIPVGVYFYSTAINELEALEEATFVLNLIKDYDITYPVVYDFELFNDKRTTGVSDRVINNNAIKFLDYIRAHGYNGMLYTNLHAINNHWDISKFEGYRIWFAQYIEEATYEGYYDMWQYSDRGKVDGIVGNVDLNEGYIAYRVIQ